MNTLVNEAKAEVADGCGTLTVVAVTSSPGCGQAARRWRVTRAPGTAPGLRCRTGRREAVTRTGDPEGSKSSSGGETSAVGRLPIEGVTPPPLLSGTKAVTFSSRALTGSHPTEEHDLEGTALLCRQGSRHTHKRFPPPLPACGALPHTSRQQPAQRTRAFGPIRAALAGFACSTRGGYVVNAEGAPRGRPFLIRYSNGSAGPCPDERPNPLDRTPTPSRYHRTPFCVLKLKDRR
jgi:hypothetical protein